MIFTWSRPQQRSQAVPMIVVKVETSSSQTRLKKRKGVALSCNGSVREGGNQGIWPSSWFLQSAPAEHAPARKMHFMWVRPRLPSSKKPLYLREGTAKHPDVLSRSESEHRVKVNSAETQPPTPHCALNTPQEYKWEIIFCAWGLVM